MRRTVRNLAIVCVVEGTLALILSLSASNAGEGSPGFLVYLLAEVLSLLGVALALVTAGLGIASAARERKFGWLVGTIIAILVPIAGPSLVSAISPLLVTPFDPEKCVGNPCYPTSLQTFMQNLPHDVFLVGPAVVGLVVLLYSYRMKA